MGIRSRLTALALFAAVCLALRTAEGVSAIDHDALLHAIAVVESRDGRASPNVYQLTPVYVRDVRRIASLRVSYALAARDRATARLCVLAYWRHYGASYERRTGRRATAEVLARIHNGGPDGWRKRTTRGYWRKVRLVYDAELRARAMAGAGKRR